MKRYELIYPTDEYVGEFPFFYYVLDTGNCQKPTQERVYRLWVDPNDETKMTLDYWGNLGSTLAVIHNNLVLRDVTDKEHLVKITVENGRIVLTDVTTYQPSTHDESGEVTY